MGSRGKTEKVSVTLPRELAGEIRSVVSSGEVSAFVAEALEHYLAFRKQKVALETGFGAWEDKSHSDLITPEDSMTYVRRVRAADKRLVDRGGDLAK